MYLRFCFMTSFYREVDPAKMVNYLKILEMKANIFSEFFEDNLDQKTKTKTLQVSRQNYLNGTRSDLPKS